MDQQISETRDAVVSYYKAVQEIVGFYCGSQMAFRWTAERLEKMQQEVLAHLNAQGSRLDRETLDRREMFYAHGDPDQPDSVVFYKSPQGDVRRRFEDGGDYHRTLGNVCLVQI